MPTNRSTVMDHRYRPHAWAKAGGFTLIELLIGIVLVAITAAGAASILSSSNRSLVKGRNEDRRQAVIDADVARVRNLSARFSCCSGTCKLLEDSAGDPGCLTTTVGDDRSYYPQTGPGLEALEGTDGMSGLCNSRDADPAKPSIAAEFRKLLDSSGITLGNPTTTELNAAGLALQVQRIPEVMLLDYNPTATPPSSPSYGRDHRIELQYSTDASIGTPVRVLRTVYLTPVAASWCP